MVFFIGTFVVEIYLRAVPIQHTLTYYSCLLNLNFLIKGKSTNGKILFIIEDDNVEKNLRRCGQNPIQEWIDMIELEAKGQKLVCTQIGLKIC